MEPGRQAMLETLREIREAMTAMGELCASTADMVEQLTRMMEDRTNDE